MNYDPPPQQGAAQRQAGSSGVSEMGKRRFSTRERIEILREHERGMTVAEVCRRYSISPTTFYKWRAKLVDAMSSEPSSGEDSRISALVDENRRLKKLLGEQVLDNSILKEMLAKKGK
jgi:putative transposase